MMAKRRLTDSLIRSVILDAMCEQMRLYSQGDKAFGRAFVFLTAQGGLPDDIDRVTRSIFADLRSQAEVAKAA